MVWSGLVTSLAWVTPGGMQKRAARRQASRTRFRVLHMSSQTHVGGPPMLSLCGGQMRTSAVSTAPRLEHWPMIR